MPCPYAGGADSRETVDREAFLRSTLVIGGRDALQAAHARYGPPQFDQSGAAPTGGSQYDWTDAAGEDAGDTASARDDSTAAAGCPVDHASAGSQDDPEDHTHAGEDSVAAEYDGFRSAWPAYHVVYRLTHEGEDAATDRRRLVDALTGLTERVGWGGDGVTWAVGYAPDHLADAASVPASLRPTPADVATDGGHAVAADCLLHLASDSPRTLLAAETLLWDGADGLPVASASAETVEDAYPRPTAPPERLVTISPHDADAPGVAGDAVLRLSAHEDDHPGNDGDRQHATHGGSGHDAADREGADCPVDHGDADETASDRRRTDAVALRHLNPADPGVLRVELVDPADAADRPSTERYYLPEAGDRAVATPE